jgi:hypothetical protein
VLAQCRLVVEHIAPRRWVLREDVLQNLTHGAADGFGLRAGDMALDVCCEDDSSYWFAPRGGLIPSQTTTSLPGP